MKIYEQNIANASNASAVQRAQALSFNAAAVEVVIEVMIDLFCHKITKIVKLFEILS